MQVVVKSWYELNILTHKKNRPSLWQNFLYLSQLDFQFYDYENNLQIFLH